MNFYPLANEFWGKVIFSEVCVRNSVYRGSLYDVTSFLAAWSYISSRGVSFPGAMFLPGESLCRGGGLFPGVSDQGVSV